MVKLVSLYLLGTHKQNFQYSMLNFSRTCFFFRSSFSLTVFIKFFLTQKSKSRKNWGTLSRGKLSGPNYLWGNHPRTNYPEGNDPGQFSGGNCPREQLSGRQSSRGQLSRGHFLRGQTNIIWCFFSLKFKNSLFRKKLFRCRFLSKRTV